MKASQVRLIMGLVALPAILLQDNLIGILLQTLYVIVLAVSHGRKFRVLPNLILLVSVSSAHLLQPNGLHLFSIGSFPITVGALLLGARKAFTLISLLYLSHYMITGKPQFPGKLGRLISLQFYYFDAITTRWRSITPKRPFIAAIDQLMHSLAADNLTEAAASQPIATSSSQPQASHRALIANGIHLLVFWGLFLLGSLRILPALM